MTIRKAVKELEKLSEITDMNDFLTAVRKRTRSTSTNKVLKSKVLEEFINENEIILSIINPEELIYRSQLAENAKVTVKITDEEKVMRKLYLGHRLMPYINPKNIHLPDLHFEDDHGYKLPLIQDRIPQDKAMKYVLFMDIRFFNDHFDGDNYLLQCLNISTFNPKHTMFEISVLDYHKRKFRIAAISDSDYLARHFINRRKDIELWNGVLQVVNHNHQIISVDHTIINAYHHFAADNISEPGSPFSLLFNIQKDCEMHFDQFCNYFTSQQKMELIRQKSYSNIIYGTAKDLNGIFREMGLSFNQDFIYLEMISQLLENREIDDEYNLDELIEIDFRLANDKQADNLDKAYKRLQQKAIRDFVDFDTGAVSKSYLNDLLVLVEDILFLIRDFDDLDDMDYQEKMNVLLPLIDVDRLLVSLMKNFIKSKKADPREVEQFKQIEDETTKVIDLIRAEFDLM